MLSGPAALGPAVRRVWFSNLTTTSCDECYHPRTLQEQYKEPLYLLTTLFQYGLMVRSDWRVTAALQPARYHITI